MSHAAPPLSSRAHVPGRSSQPPTIDPRLLAAEVERTLRHEIAHHLGHSERAVAALGL